MPTRKSVAAPMAPMTDHTNGLWPCASTQGWKWSESTTSLNPASSAATA